MTDQPPPYPTLADVLAHMDARFDILAARLDVLDVRAERVALETQRALFAIERKIGHIEDALADWAGNYWQHTEHPPRAS